MVLSGLILLFLLQQSVFLTTQDTRTMDTGTTKGFYTADTPWLHLAVFALLATGARLWGRHACRTEKQHKAAKLAIAAVALVLLAWLICSCRMEPAKDAAEVYNAARKLLSGDLSPLGKGGYIDLCPNQIGLLWYDMAFLALFGENAAIAIQLANVLCDRSLFFLGSCPPQELPALGSDHSYVVADSSGDCRCASGSLPRHRTGAGRRKACNFLACIGNAGH